MPTEAELARAEGREYEAADVLLARILKERRTAWENEQIVKFKKNGEMQNDNKWKLKYKPPVFPNIEKLPNLTEGWTWASPEVSFWMRKQNMYQMLKKKNYDHIGFLREIF